MKTKTGNSSTSVRGTTIDKKNVAPGYRGINPVQTNKEGDTGQDSIPWVINHSRGKFPQSLHLRIHGAIDAESNGHSTVDSEFMCGLSSHLHQTVRNSGTRR